MYVLHEIIGQFQQCSLT
uniref:Uncharacterized protein n=1 Tax=Rhizophora mucronata TaxID=61149 RepID=A0A2P2N7L0_RHIMU